MIFLEVKKFEIDDKSPLFLLEEFWLDLSFEQFVIKRCCFVFEIYKTNEEEWFYALTN